MDVIQFEENEVGLGQQMSIISLRDQEFIVDKVSPIT